ncbi:MULTISPECIES: hypothetical protein [unclassified Streptomyces]|uniref:Rv1733c family protein n=1 Tax=unclassified Streptomyces TaxID=2593676 RepID=UPI0037022E9B
MGTQDSPHASRPDGPQRQQRPAKGPKPLGRTTDRIEAWCSRLLLLVLVLGLPVASVSAGLAAHASTLRIAQAQSAQRHQVPARVTSAPGAAPGSAANEKQTVRVTWTGKDGRQRTGTAQVPLAVTVGSSVRIWVDRAGSVQDPPLSASNATATGWLTGGLTAVGVYTCYVTGRMGVRRALNRRRCAQWDAEWELVEPLWSARSYG